MGRVHSADALVTTIEQILIVLIQAPRTPHGIGHNDSVIAANDIHQVVLGESVPDILGREVRLLRVVIVCQWRGFGAHQLGQAVVGVPHGGHIDTQFPVFDHGRRLADGIEAVIEPPSRHDHHAHWFGIHDLVGDATARDKVIRHYVSL